VTAREDSKCFVELDRQTPEDAAFEADLLAGRIPFLRALGACQDALNEGLPGAYTRSKRARYSSGCNRKSNYA